MRAVKSCWVIPSALLWATGLAQDFPIPGRDTNGNVLPNYAPVRPPAIPLAVRSPYTNVWSTTSKSSTLNSLSPRFWPGDYVGWEGIVTVDKVSYEYMGNAINELPPLSSFKSAIPQDVSYDSQYSNFTFVAGPVLVTASFFSPVIPMDTCRTSIPLSYLTTSVESTDGKSHSVKFYSDASANWVGQYWDWQIVSGMYKGATPFNGQVNDTKAPDEIYSWISRRRDQFVFGDMGDFPQWGNFSYNTSPMGAKNFTFKSGFTDSIRFEYLNKLELTGPEPRLFGNRTPIFAFAHDFDSTSKASVRYTVGTIQDPVIKYMHSGGMAELAPWWRKCYGELYEMIHFHWDDFHEAQALGGAFEAQLKTDIDIFYEGAEQPISTKNALGKLQLMVNGTDQYGQQYHFDSDTAYGFISPNNSSGIAVPFVSEAESYYAIVALSARQVMGAYVYAVSPGESCEGKGSNGSKPLMFQKEISSNGNMNTVDVIYPVSPFFLYANPELLRYVLEPLFEIQEANLYPQGYCMHDIGTHYPNATGHVMGDDEYMPVEESGNIILMSYAYYKFTGDVDYLRQHYPLLIQFAQYLVRFSLVPAVQFSTDDFAGTLANQTNLALKGIVGLQAMASIARVIDETNDAIFLSTTAQGYYKKWEELAIDPSGKHTMLAYQWRSSWGLLYNMFYDKLLNMGLVSPSLYNTQSHWYATVSQAFGIPLDSRAALTKSDWALWAASASAPSTRRLAVNALAYWLNETSTEHPFGDLFMTTGSGYYPPNGATFKARPVAGGHYALLALGRTGQRARTADAGSTEGSLFVRNGTDALVVGPDAGAEGTKMQPSVITVTVPVTGPATPLATDNFVNVTDLSADAAAVEQGMRKVKRERVVRKLGPGVQTPGAV